MSELTAKQKTFIEELPKTSGTEHEQLSQLATAKRARVLWLAGY